ncbi:MAG: hypothetical protein WA728_05890 [Xanthobacteraceae bacterium]
MAVFRIYTLGLDARFIHAKDIEGADEQEAIQKAQQAVDDRDIELWERDRFITRLAAAKPGTKK